MKRSWANAIKGSFASFFIFMFIVDVWSIATMDAFWRNARTYTIDGILGAVFLGIFITLCIGIHRDGK